MAMANLEPIVDHRGFDVVIALLVSSSVLHRHGAVLIEIGRPLTHLDQILEPTIRPYLRRRTSNSTGMVIGRISALSRYVGEASADRLGAML
jgi:hypothetical protein